MSETESQADPFDDYTEALTKLDQAARRRLTPWQQHLLLFRRFTDEIVWEGLLVAVANFWTSRGQVLATLKAVGALEQADVLDKTIRQVTTSRFGVRSTLDPDAVAADPVKLSAFSTAEAAINEGWVAMWGRAASFARLHGWTESARV